MPALKPILLLDDDTLDAMIVTRTLGKLDVRNPVVHTTNGEEGPDYLQRGPDERPCLILLDLNIPRMNGLEFLQRIRAEEAFKDMDVIILTTSSHREDIAAGFRLGVKGYIIKCIDSETFARELSIVEDYCSESRELQAVESEEARS